MHKAHRCFCAEFEDVWVMLSQVSHLVSGDFGVAEWRRPICCALEDCKRFYGRFFRDRCYCLDACRACADYTNAFVAKVSRQFKVLGPARSVEGATFEVMDSRNVGECRRGQKAHARDEEASFMFSPVGVGEEPGVGVLLPHCRSDFSVVSDILV